MIVTQFYYEGEQCIVAARADELFSSLEDVPLFFYVWRDYEFIEFADPAELAAGRTAHGTYIIDIESYKYMNSMALTL